MEQNTNIQNVVSSTKPRAPRYAMSPGLDWGAWFVCTVVLLVTSAVRTPLWLTVIVGLGLLTSACWLMVTVMDIRAARRGRYRDVSQVKAPMFIRL